MPFKMKDSFKFIFEKMSEHYETLLKSGNLSDVVLAVGGKDLRVHKVILSARSPVFNAMFAHSSTKEAHENRVEIIDVDVEVVELMVRYIYTGKIEHLDRNVADLFVIADKYQVDCLKSICEQQLLSQITVESVSDLLIFADTYPATELYSACLDYIINNVTEVVASEGWKQKIVAKADLLVKLYENLNLKYTNLIYDKSTTYYEYFLRSIGLDVEQKVESTKEDGNDLTLGADLDFEYYLLKYSYVLDYKEVMSDVVLAVGGKELKVHKQVLSARSPVFANMFAQDSTTEVNITDVDVEVLEMLIKYIYTGRVEGLDRYSAQLLSAAHKYQLDCLKSICEQKLLSKLANNTTESVSELLILADTHQATDLYNYCLKHITNNATRVMASNGWKHIVAKAHLVAKLFEHLSLRYCEVQDARNLHMRCLHIIHASIHGVPDYDDDSWYNKNYNDSDSD